MSSHQPTSDHTRADRSPPDALPGVIHGSFSLSARVLASHDDVIDRLLSFAFDVLDLNSVEVRVYEPSDAGERDNQ